MIKLLLPLSWLYAAVNRCRAQLYRSGVWKAERLPGKVISVGNIEVGGTGKSPVVVALCQALRAQGARPVVLTRGYKSGLKPSESVVLKGQAILLGPSEGSPFHADEAQMQAAQLEDVPIIVGRKRYQAAQSYLTHFPVPTHWILDDGFQHLQLERDFDLVLLDAKRPLDNGYCLPVGRLRESPQALRRAHALLLTRADPAKPTPVPPALKVSAPLYRVQFCDGIPLQVAGPPQPQRSISHWTLALGIARPERIKSSLQQKGLTIAQTYLTGDHESFDFQRLRTLVPSGGALLTTEKDYWRASREFSGLGIPIYVLPLQLEWLEAGTLSKIVASFT